MKKTATSLVAAAILPLAMPASAELKYENASDGSVVLYGQFDPAYLSFDDGVSTTSEFVDNAHSNSRVGLWLRQNYGSNVFAFNFETALGFRQSGSVSQTNTPSAVDWQRTNIRKVDFSLRTERFGRFYAGQGSMATDGIADGEYSGTSLVNYNSIGDTAGSFQFRTAGGALSGITVGSVTPNFDGARRGRVRYDTPTFSGFTVSVAAGKEILSSTNNDEFYDIALRYNNEFGGTKVQGGLGYSLTENPNGTTKFNDTIGSFAVLFSSGWNFGVAAGNRKQSGDYMYGKLGYLAQWFSVGGTAIAVDYYDGNDMSSAGSSSKSYGIGVAQTFSEANVIAYLGYRKYELTDTSTAYLDAESILFGARWQF